MSSAEANAAPQSRRPRDMIMSLAVLLIPIGLFFAAWSFLTSDDQVHEIDPAESYAEAAALGLDPAPHPEGLPSDWQPLSSAATLDDEGAPVLRVGYHTPEGAGMQLVAAAGDPETTLVRELGEAPRPEGEQELAGRTWMQYTTVDGNNALVLHLDSELWIVYGDAGLDELSQFAAALQA